jgi:hypothetical protein
VIAVLALAAGVPADFPAATPATIEEIRRDPRHWNGKWVQVEGWINRCYATECELSEHLAARPSNQGMSLSFEGQQTFDDWAKPSIPVHALVVANFDETCLVDEVCIGRAPMLRQMHVQALETNLKFPDK